jgi:tyrosinase
MASFIVTRRDFIKCSASAIAIASFPSFVYAQTKYTRLEWQQFKTTPQYASYINAIRAMRNNTNQNSNGSWQYWSNVHRKYCPHDAAYFLAWHRGYLYHFERQLRTISQDPNLTLPYWDYYKYPRIPAEFTDTATNNPLYVQRASTNVYNALTLAPFASSVVNFQRGTSNAFEPSIESAPHNPVHNLIGGYMANVSTAPLDPIFYLHHANIDRLWNAWVLSGGKNVPTTSNPYNSRTSSSYWSGSFSYASNLNLSRYLTYTPDWLNYSTADNTQPSSLPASARTTTDGSFKLVQAQMQALLTRPAIGNFPAVAARAISATDRSLGGVAGIALTENSISARIPLTPSNLNTLRSAVAAGASASAGTLRSAKLVLDNPRLVGAGANGGFFYNVYVNLPPSGDAGDSQKYFVGTVGPFELSAAQQHGSGSIEYAATDTLAGLLASDLQELTVSFVRVDGGNGPRGQVLSIGELRIEVSTDAPSASGT